MTRRQLFLALGGGATLASAADWKNAQFPKWSDDTVLRLLIDSPWAHVRTVRVTWYGRREEASKITYKDIPGTSPNRPASSTAPGGSPVGGIGPAKTRNRLPEQADLIFRWASALPVRQAKALYRQRQDKTDVAKLSETVESRGGSGYVFEVFGIPTLAAHAGVEALSARLNQSAALRTKAGRIIRSERVETAITGDQLTSTIHFPRAEPLRLDEGEVEVIGNADLFEFRERFRLRDMMYLDSLEL